MPKKSRRRYSKRKQTHPSVQNVDPSPTVVVRATYAKRVGPLPVVVESWELISDKNTIEVKVENHTIVDASEKHRAFVGMTFASLLDWMSGQPGFKAKRLGGWKTAEKEKG